MSNKSLKVDNEKTFMQSLDFIDFMQQYTKDQCFKMAKTFTVLTPLKNPRIFNSIPQLYRKIQDILQLYILHSPH